LPLTTSQPGNKNNSWHDFVNETMFQDAKHLYDMCFCCIVLVESSLRMAYIHFCFSASSVGNWKHVLSGHCRSCPSNEAHSELSLGTYTNNWKKQQQFKCNCWLISIMCLQIKFCGLIQALHLCRDWLVEKTNMCKFESSQEDESRAHSAESWKAYSKLEAFNGVHILSN